MEEPKKIRYKHFKFTILVGSVISFFVLSLMTLLIFDITHSSKQFKIKSKRFVDSTGHGVSKILEPVKEIKDIQLIPDWESNNRKMDHYPNHKYDEIESTHQIYTKMMKDLYPHQGWSLRSFQKIPKGSFNSLRNAVLKKNPEFKVNHFMDDDSRGFGKMKLKGVYLHPDEEDTTEDQDKEFSGNYYYLKEINELMQTDSNAMGDEEKRSLKKAFKGHGSGFQPPPKENNAQTYNYWKKEKKPITILLEIYPMTNTKQHPGKYSPPRRLPNGMAYNPKSPWEHFGPKTDRGEKLIMKLNLFPKKNKYLHEYSGSNKRMEKKIWRKKLKNSLKPSNIKLPSINQRSRIMRKPVV